jgi:predicted membrane-bound spermidine synthase
MAILYSAIFLTTLSVLMLELGLTRLFSATMYYHFAFLAISLALFGSGASGVFIYTIQRRFNERRTGAWLGIFSLCFSLSALFALYIILTQPLPSSSTAGAAYYRLTKIYCASALPFFFAGCTVTLAITRFAKNISKLYLFDLIGAAAGCLLLIPVINRIGAINLVFLVSTIAAAAGLLFILNQGGNRALAVFSGLMAIALAGLTFYNSVARLFDIQVSKGVREEKVLFSKWNSFSRITLHGDINHGMSIKIDADAETAIIPKGTDIERWNGIKEHIASLAYNLKDKPDVLIIGPGGGLDITTALVFGAKSIAAVEVNPIIARDIMSSEPARTYSGNLYGHPKVKLAVDEGRSYIRKSKNRYDIIQATLVDTWAATSAGAFALTENNLYTVEAFKDYVAHLSDDGVLTMTRWYFDPPDQLLRLVSLTRTMMSELGINHPERHLMLVLGPRGGVTPATYIFKKSEFTDREVQEIEKVAREKRFELLYTPLTRHQNIFTRMIEAPDPEAIWNSFETNVAPTRDNSPFFFHSLRFSSLSRAFRGVGEWQKTNLGSFMLFALLGITSILVILCILGPLLLVQRRSLAEGRRGKIAYLLYFACLGMGFIMVEMAMMQKFILFLGHPVYSLTVILFSLLLFSGLGSYLTGYFHSDRLASTLARILAGLVALVLLYILVLPYLFYVLLHMPLALRIMTTIILMSPLAMLMGMPMPIGIRILSSASPEIIPWAWGVNGAASVMGSAAALVVAILAGFNQALIIACGFYLIAIFFASRGKPNSVMAQAAAQPHFSER